MIKIELIQLAQPESIVLLFETLHLPVANTESFFVIQKLLETIFLPWKKIYTWNDSEKDLHALVRSKYLTKTILTNLNIIPLQERFKQWYNKTFKHNEGCNVPSFYKDDSLYCTCSHRPYKNINDKWILHTAINYIFDEFIHRSTETDMASPYDINYSIIYCLAITKLTTVIELDWTVEQLYQYKKFHHGKYTFLSY